MRAIGQDSDSVVEAWHYAWENRGVLRQYNLRNRPRLSDEVTVAAYVNLIHEAVGLSEDQETG